MAARTRREASELLLAPLRQALACFTPQAVLVQRHDPAVDATVVTTANGNPIPLRDSSGVPVVALLLRLHYRVVPLPYADSGLEGRTVAYAHQLEGIGDPPRELLRFEWHPHIAGIPFPHVHVLAGQANGRGITPRTHMPTGLLTTQHVLTFVVRDLAVAVRQHRGEWQQLKIATTCARRWAASTSTGDPSHDPLSRVQASVPGTGDVS
ncbi:MAG: hypothetical protein HY332_07705 [Chloroflexi bacterium]|nr:hypothetical protein [Chloroflexota bacterium]